MQNTKRNAFTLVELIVVVTILAILATIGFVSYSSYLTWVRDTNRLAQLTSISDGLNLYSTQNDLPLPDDNVEIQVSSETIAYQWYAGVNTLESIDFTKWGKDPKDDQYFSYYLTKDRKYFQLMAFLEEETNAITLFPQTQALDYSSRMPTVTGKKLWILTDENNTPIQEVISTALVFDGTGDNYIAHIDGETIVTGNDTTVLQWTFSVSSGRKHQSCKSILETNSLVLWADGEYWITPQWSNSMKVYCDMTTDGWGWMKISAQVENEAERLKWAQYLSDNRSESYDVNNCIECGSFPQYLRDVESNLFCFWKLNDTFGIKVSDTEVEASFSWITSRLWRDGLFHYLYSWSYVIRSEWEHDYDVYEEVLCR